MKELVMFGIKLDNKRREILHLSKSLLGFFYAPGLYSKQMKLNNNSCTGAPLYIRRRSL